MSEHLSCVKELIKIQKGDLGRLERIRKILESKGQLHDSDTAYVESLSNEYLQDYETRLSQDIHDKQKSPESQTFKHVEKPLSRFWACFFCGTIFALFWTQKMKKTFKWIPIFTLFVFAWFVIDLIIYPYDDQITHAENLVNYMLFDPTPHTEPVEFFVNDILIIPMNDGVISGDAYSVELAYFVFDMIMVILYHLIVWVGTITLAIYYMLKWTTQYNLEHFGYKSKREWKKSINGNYNNTKIVKKELKIIGSEIKDGLSSTLSSLSPKTKTKDDEMIAKISKWYGLMEKGIISKSEFENKKTELLKNKNSD